MMEALLWVLLPGFVALASGLLAWFVMQSRMEVALAEQRERLASERGALQAERAAMDASITAALHAAGESARREAFDGFLAELKVQQRHYTRENRTLTHNRRSLVLQERIYFRNLPLSDWIEHEIPLDDGADASRLAEDMTVFDRAVVSIAENRRHQKALA